MNLIRRWIISELSKGKPKTAQQIKKKYIERYKNWKKVDIIDQHIYSNAQALVDDGFITLIIQDNEPKRYAFKEGCINGILIAKLKLKNDERVLIMECVDEDICNIPENNKIREITKDCKYYEVYKKLRSMMPSFENRIH